MYLIPRKDSMEEEKLRPVIEAGETQRYHDLGLGRGVNVTDPHMWRNKSHFLVRKVINEKSHVNIIGTEESGMKEKYEKEVSTVATQQVKIRLSLDEPSSQVKIGMDAQHSQSTSTTKRISGTKIKTRTISFRADCNDLPAFTFVYNQSSKGLPPPQSSGLSLHSSQYIGPPSPQSSDRGESTNDFEKTLYSWIFKRIHGRQGKKRPPGETLDQYLCELQSDPESPELKEELKEIMKDCKLFVKNLGITHYVSSIELGALEYNVYTGRSRQMRLGAGAEVGAGQMAEGGISGLTEKWSFQTSRHQHEIGKIVNGTVKRNTTNEAVIGFQIQPIHNLVGLQDIQVALQRAVQKYIEFKADKSVGPFLISCKINKECIYWKADEDEHQVIGTNCKENASLFFISPTDDLHHPSEFCIKHYKQQEFDDTDPFMKIQVKTSQQPQYVASNSNLLGFSSRPLDMKSTLLTQKARFSLHSRVQRSFTCMMCMSTPVSLNDWIEGEELYIKCCQRSFKVDGYVAMKERNSSNTSSSDTNCKEKAQTDTYMTRTVASMKDPTKTEDRGMLFQLSRCKQKKPQSQEPLQSYSDDETSLEDERYAFDCLLLGSEGNGSLDERDDQLGKFWDRSTSPLKTFRDCSTSPLRPPCPIRPRSISTLTPSSLGLTETADHYTPTHYCPEITSVGQTPSINTLRNTQTQTGLTISHDPVSLASGLDITTQPGIEVPAGSIKHEVTSSWSSEDSSSFSSLESEQLTTSKQTQMPAQQVPSLPSSISSSIPSTPELNQESHQINTFRNKQARTCSLIANDQRTTGLSSDTQLRIGSEVPEDSTKQHRSLRRPSRSQVARSQRRTQRTREPPRITSLSSTTTKHSHQANTYAERYAQIFGDD